MLRNLLAALAVIGAPVLAAATSVQPTPRATPPAATAENGARVRVAQACWYAILACSTSNREANNWMNRHGVGEVINTSSDEFPNFTRGYYCVVIGPSGQSQAQATARSYRGISPTSYAKSGC